jgi:nucleoside triphosphatase
MHYSENLHQQCPDTEIKVPAVTVLILNDEAQVLALKPKGKERWILPWGEMKSNETAVEAIARIAKAETGLELLDVECVGFASAHKSVHVNNENGHPQHIHLFTFVSTYFSGQLRLKNAFEVVEFFSISELPALATPFDGSVEAFKRWLPTREMQFW